MLATTNRSPSPIRSQTRSNVSVLTPTDTAVCRCCHLQQQCSGAATYRVNQPGARSPIAQTSLALGDRTVRYGYPMFITFAGIVVLRRSSYASMLGRPQ